MATRSNTEGSNEWRGSHRLIMNMHMSLTERRFSCLHREDKDVRKKLNIESKMVGTIANR